MQIVLDDLTKTLQIEKLIVPPAFDQQIAKSFRSQLGHLRKQTATLCRAKTRQYEFEQMRFFIQKRCDDLKEDQSSMLDSILNRKKRSIIIDRLLIDNELELDPDIIKSATNKHFQTVTNSHHSPANIPEDWQDFYLPQDHIDSSIYNSLMHPPSFDEWLAIVNSAPHHKAAGPSGISYEIIQHLGPLMAKLLHKLICACMHLAIIPTAWRKALVYPIPKPKDWNHDLNNTRPITDRKSVV